MFETISNWNDSYGNVNRKQSKSSLKITIETISAFVSSNKQNYDPQNDKVQNIAFLTFNPYPLIEVILLMSEYGCLMVFSTQRI